MKYPTKDKFIIKNGIVESVDDLIVWAKWMESEEGRKERRIAWTEVGDYNVSTVFLGLDYSFSMSEDRLPVLFETMVFENKESTDEINGKPYTFHKSLDDFGGRWCTIEEARAEHDKVVEEVKNYKSTK